MTTMTYPAPTSAATESAPDLSRSGILAQLGVSCWSARRFDGKITSEVTRERQAQAGAGRWNKHLFGGKEPLHARVVACAGALRKAHYTHTLPWSDHGQRILPAANWDAYQAAIREARVAFNEAADAFVDAYPTLVQAARARLGDTFSPDDYPPHSTIRERFAVSVSFAPVPDSGDIRVDLPASEVERIKRDTEASVAAAAGEAVREAFGRLESVVRRVRDTLRDTEARGGRGRVFHTSMIQNLRDTCRLMSRMNFTQDRELAALCSEIESSIGSLDPKHLRESPPARSEAARRADDLVRRLKGVC